MLLIGVDGGGTHSRLAACDGTGRIVARAACGGLNYNSIGLYAARRNLCAGIDDLLDAADADWFDGAAVGLSALDGEADEATLLQFCGEALDPARLYLHSDAHMTLVGAAGGEAGMVVISGTGSMGAAVDEAGREYAAGGWGWLLNDEGSGFDIGNRVIRAAVRAGEGGEPTLLREMVLEWFGVERMREIIPVLYAEEAGVPAVAAAARLADLAADNGDEVAARIVDEAAESLARTARALTDETGVLPVYTWGGVFEHSPRFRRRFEAHLARLVPGAPVRSARLRPEEGALVCAARRAGVWSEAFERTLETSARETENA